MDRKPTEPAAARSHMPPSLTSADVQNILKGHEKLKTVPVRPSLEVSLGLHLEESLLDRASELAMSRSIPLAILDYAFNWPDPFLTLPGAPFDVPADAVLIDCRRLATIEERSAAVTRALEVLGGPGWQERTPPVR